MLVTELPTLIDSAGVLNTPALAGVLRGTEIVLIFIRRVFPKSYDQPYKCSRSGEGVFHDTPHSVLHA
jgi:hypothetical protein